QATPAFGIRAERISHLRYQEADNTHVPVSCRPEEGRLATASPAIYLSSVLEQQLCCAKVTVLSRKHQRRSSIIIPAIDNNTWKS
ncbi:hypothetical protein H633G_11567, partial [Metarhizium anisopliae BRIP 53284]